MSNFRDVLETKEAKEAIGEGFEKLVETGNLEEGIEAMLNRGSENGSLTKVKIAVILDALGLSDVND